MKVIGIDQSYVASGWAIQDGTNAEWGTMGLQEKKEPCSPRHFVKFSAWLLKLIQEEKPTLIVYEEPNCHGQGGNVLTLIGLRTLIVTIAERHNVPTLGVYATTLKKWATGTGKAEKPLMQATAKERFPHYVPSDDVGGNESDALLLMCFGIERPDLQLQNEKPKPKKRRVKKNVPTP